MGKKISTENGQSTKLGSGHRHLVWLGKVDLLYNSYISNNFLFIR